jgi:opacity protein-like surface antigen
MRDRERACAVALLLCAGTAHAADTGFYFGVFAGQAKYDFDSPQLPIIGQIPDGGFIGPGLRPPPLNPANPIVIPPAFAVATGVLWLPSDDDEATAWGATAGYRIGRYVAVELNYLNLGKLEASDLVLLPPFPGGGTTTLQRELETTGPALSVLGILPLSASWEVYLRAGVLFADMEFTTSIGASSASHTTGSEAAAVGAGVQFNWAEHWSARIELQRFLEVGEDDTFSSSADIDLLSLGIFYRL